MMICDKCFRENIDGVLVCKHCGAKIVHIPITKSKPERLSEQEPDDSAPLRVSPARDKRANLTDSIVQDALASRYFRFWLKFFGVLLGLFACALCAAVIFIPSILLKMLNQLSSL